MKKILFVTPYNPFVFPIGASSQSVRYRIGHLSEMAEVHLLTFAGREDKTIPVPDHFNVKTQFLPHPVLRNRGDSKFVRFGRTILGKIDTFENIEALSSVLGKEVQRLISNIHFDLIHIDDITIAPVMHYCPPDVKKLFFFHNLMTLQYKNIVRSKKKLFKKIISYIEYLHIKKYEKDMLRQIDHAVVLTKIEQERAKILSPGSKVYRIPLEIDLDQYVPKPDAIERYRITFTGTMSYEPNHEGALYFITTIFPLIKRDCPQAMFYVVGMNPSEDLRELSDDGIVVTGEVANIQEYICKSAVIVVPLLSGGGMRFKILVAFALGKAIVSTSVGAEGIDYQDHGDIVIADHPAHFARQVCDLLDNPRRAQDLGFKARQLIERTYDSRIVKQQWRDVYSEIMGQFSEGRRR